MSILLLPNVLVNLFCCFHNITALHYIHYSLFKFFSQSNYSFFFMMPHLNEPLMVSSFLVITARFLISFSDKFKIPIVGVINVTTKVLCAINLFIPFKSDLMYVCMYEIRDRQDPVKGSWWVIFPSTMAEQPIQQMVVGHLCF